MATTATATTTTPSESRRHARVRATRLPDALARELHALADRPADVDPATAACRALRAAELPPDLALRLERIAPAFVAAYVLALEAADLSDD